MMSNEFLLTCCPGPARIHPHFCLCGRLGKKVSVCPEGSTPGGTITTPQGTGGTPPKRYPAPDWLMRLILSVGVAGDEVSPRLLASLADGLNDVGCAGQALMVSQAARNIVRINDFNILSRTYQIEAEAHQLLGNRDLALKSHDIATHLASAARLRLDMGELPAQIQIEVSRRQ